MSPEGRARAAAAAFVLALPLAVALYGPGLHSLFIFDDLPQLQALAALHKVTTPEQFLLYTASGTTGTLGRPLAMASFAAQFYAWPSDPGAFKHANLMLHLLNACLVFLLTWRLLRRPGTGTTPAWVAAFTATAWLLHPAQVNTVLYVVQRMTELSALCTLAGLLAYVHGRERAAAGAVRRGYAWMSAGVAAGVALGVLAKENAILLPLFALVLEATLLRDLPRPRRFRAWAAMFLAAPPLALVAHVLLGFESYFTSSYRFRDFTPLERLLTECRVMFLYLRQLLLPSPDLYTFFYDDYTPSRGLLDPPVTALALAGVAALATVGWALRRRAPLAAAGILWFFTGHLLESTVLSLDLVYEHRNYLPLAGVLWVLAAAGTAAGSALQDPRLRRWLVLAPAIYLVLLGWVTWQQSRLWGQPSLQARVWWNAHPGSERAAQWAAGAAMMRGDAAGALDVYQRLAAERPHDASPLMGWLLLSCIDPAVAEPDRAEVLARIRASDRRSTMNVNSLDTLQDARLEGRCTRVDSAFLHAVLDAFLANPSHEFDAPSFRFLKGEVYFGEGRVAAAVRELDFTYERTRSPEVALIQAGWLYDAGQLDEARRYVERAAQAAARNPVKNAVMSASISAWFGMLEAAQRGGAGSHTAPGVQ